jgi:asparagine synthase (glutamine-hydrolysing)
MCGICGWIDHSNNKEEYNLRQLKKMTGVLGHRGPDEDGFWIKDNIALGHRRLSIIDLGLGQQPMFGNHGNSIVFNGEIYNYKELRSELINKGLVFRTNSDTEVILHSYEAWGEACLDRFIGMFSFVIWNPQKRELFIARDRLGKKPFYYYHGTSMFAFASEIKSLLSLKEIKENIGINPYSVSDYLSLGYILTPKTIFTGINRLPAGYYAIYGIDNGNLTLHKYWNLENFLIPGNNSIYNSKMENDFLDIFNDAVRIRLYSDVPLGAFLSGGIDSSSVVASMSHIHSTKLHTFCVGFGEDSYDESNYAETVARHLNVDLKIRPYSNPTATELSNLIWYFDEPFGDNSFIPTYQLNKLAREYVTVALSGDGGDEVLAGYSTYMADKYFKAYSVFPVFFQRWLYLMAKNLLMPSYKKVSWDYKLIRFLSSYGFSREMAHYWWRVIFNENEKKLIMSPDIFKACRGYNPFDTFKDYFDRVHHANFLDRSLFVDIKTWLQDDILVKVDRMSMANSLEVRSPFLDHRLVEFAIKLPNSAKIRDNKQKIILKNCMKKYLPAETVYRKKSGFNAPVKIGLNSPLRSELFSGNYHLNPAKEDITFKSFNLTVLNIWVDMYNRFKLMGRWEPLIYDK